MLIVCLPVVPPVTASGCALGSGTNAILLFALKLTDNEVKSTPVLPYWFDSQTYGVRPANDPTPPRICCRLSLPLLKSQLNPTRGDHIFGAGTMSVRRPKSATESGLACGVSGKFGASKRTPYVNVKLAAARH